MAASVVELPQCLTASRNMPSAVLGTSSFIAAGASRRAVADMSVPSIWLTFPRQFCACSCFYRDSVSITERPQPARLQATANNRSLDARRAKLLKMLRKFSRPVLRTHAPLYRDRTLRSFSWVKKRKRWGVDRFHRGVQLVYVCAIHLHRAHTERAAAPPDAAALAPDDWGGKLSCGQATATISSGSRST